MSKIKSLSSGLTAIALVAGIGLAYAQSTDDRNSTRPQSPTADTTLPAPADRAMPDAAVPGSTNTLPLEDRSSIDEPAPQADRG